MQDNSFELLLVSLGRYDLNHLKKQNISSDVIVANQTDFDGRETIINDGHHVEIISTTTRGVGKNRNIALLNASKDICLLGDDDIIYRDDYQKIVLNAFNGIPQADGIIFNIIDESENRNRRVNTSIKRVHSWNSLNYGAVRLAFRRSAIEKKNIWFNLQFGGGAKYGSGEDSLFIRDMLARKLKLYTYPESIATIPKSESTWFEGYNEKYYRDKGALLTALFPRMAFIMIILFIAKNKHQFQEYSFPRIIKIMYGGKREYQNNQFE